MIISNGIDIIDIRRIKKIIDKYTALDLRKDVFIQVRSVNLSYA